MLVALSLAGKNYMIGQVMVKKFDEATRVAQWYADEYKADVIMFDVHGNHSKMVSPARASQVEGGDDAGATAGSGDAGDDGHG